MGVGEGRKVARHMCVNVLTYDDMCGLDIAFYTVGGIGNSAYGCTGGRDVERDLCFDLRFMWRYVLAMQFSLPLLLFLLLLIQSWLNCIISDRMGRERYMPTFRHLQQSPKDFLWFHPTLS